MTFISSTRRVILNSAAISLFLSSSLFAQERCVTTGQWLDPQTATYVAESEVLDKLSASPIVLMGEHHQNAFHHRWHVEWVDKLYRKNAKIELAIEMLPVQAQPAIDQWLASEITDEQFVQRSGWNEYWSHDVNLYFPLLRYAKEKRIPIHAINVSDALFKAVSENGWNAIPEDKREGMRNPAKPNRDYLVQLARSFRRHGAPTGSEVSPEEGARFKRFIEVQLLWDRAMAEGIARIRGQESKPQTIAFMGSGHMMHGLGAPIQLRDLQLNEFVIVVPWDDHLDCAELVPGFADVVYGSPPNEN